MLRLFFIRFFESYFRAPIFYLLPIVGFMLAVGGRLVLEPQIFLTGNTVYVDSNELYRTLRLNSNFETEGENELTTRSVAELKALMYSDDFLDDVLGRIDFSQPVYYMSSMRDEREFREDIIEGTTIIAVGTNKFSIVVKLENPELAIVLANKIYEAYLDHKIAQSNANYGPTEILLDDLVAVYQDRVDAISIELNDYLIAHPEPEAYELSRRDIEVVQIERLQLALADAEEQLVDIQYQQANFELEKNLSESTLRKTYLLIDAAYRSIEMTTTTKQVNMIINYFWLGLLTSIILILVNALVGRKIIFPVDIENRFDIPVLSTIPHDGRPERPGRFKRFLIRTGIREEQTTNLPAVLADDKYAKPLPSRKDRGQKRRNS